LSGVCRSQQLDALRRPFPSPGMSTPDTSGPSFCRVFNAAEVAKDFRAELLAATAASETLRGRKPKLVGFLATDSTPSRSYAEWTRKACEDVGIEYELREIGHAEPRSSLDEPQLEGTSANGGLGEIEEKLLEANQDPDVNGIMASLELFCLCPALLLICEFRSTTLCTRQDRYDVSARHGLN
jgi:Tetrahydrofolate dehydrogenase/cyclohydrolase, catalytic domain